MKQYGLEVIITDEGHNYGEESQSSIVQFAPCKITDDDTLVNTNPFFLCKDFLSDSYLSRRVRKPIRIYGYEFDDYINLRSTTFLMKVPNKEWDPRPILDFFASITGTKAGGEVYTTNEKSIYVVRLHQFWNLPAPISFATFLLRCSVTFPVLTGESLEEYMVRIAEKEKHAYHSDSSYMKKLKDMLDNNNLSLSFEWLREYKKYFDINRVEIHKLADPAFINQYHNYLGIRSINVMINDNISSFLNFLKQEKAG